jgi:hypothetical protein
MLAELRQQHDRIALELQETLTKYLGEPRPQGIEKTRLRNRISVLLAREKLCFSRRLDILEAMEENDSENHE